MSLSREEILERVRELHRHAVDRLREGDFAHAEARYATGHYAYVLEKLVEEADAPSPQGDTAK